jgi:hypothetical protein
MSFSSFVDLLGQLRDARGEHRRIRRRAERVRDGLHAVEDRHDGVDDVEERHQRRQRGLDLLHQVDGLDARSPPGSVMTKGSGAPGFRGRSAGPRAPPSDRVRDGRTTRPPMVICVRLELMAPTALMVIAVVPSSVMVFSSASKTRWSPVLRLVSLSFRPPSSRRARCGRSASRARGCRAGPSAPPRGPRSRRSASPSARTGSRARRCRPG